MFSTAAFREVSEMKISFTRYTEVMMIFKFPFKNKSRKSLLGERKRNVGMVIDYLPHVICVLDYRKSIITEDTGIHVETTVDSLFPFLSWVELRRLDILSNDLNSQWWSKTRTLCNIKLYMI